MIAPSSGGMRASVCRGVADAVFCSGEEGGGGFCFGGHQENPVVGIVFVGSSRSTAVTALFILSSTKEGSGCSAGIECDMQAGFI